ncbi:MAG: alpha-ketoacid dehydrogenase subunit beta [spirochete symbiont of Stewartia floridana]|nr:MAG: alpha-ketoacid dehydrogenase subunit beta [spirochete symbiont of Stewartia floridana]
MPEITYAEAIREAMSLEMRSDPDVFLMGEDVGVYGGAFGVSLGMIDEFGEERVRDTPIAEAGIIGTAVGAAVAGMRPIAEIQFSDFIMLGMDMLVNQAAKIRYMFGGNAAVPMTLRAPEGSGTGAAAQHSSSMEAWYAHVPGLKVVTPSTPRDAKGLLISSIRDNNPVVFLEQKLLYRVKGEVPDGEFTIPLSRSDMKREGKHLTIVTWGRMVQMCLETAEIYKAKGIEIEIIDPRTLLPLDDGPIIESAKKTGHVVVVHEAVQTGGFGGEIAARIADSDAFYYLDAPIKRVGGLDIPIPYNPNLERLAVPTVENISAVINESLGLKE